MKDVLDPARLERLRAAVTARLGLQVDDTGLETLATVAAERLRGRPADAWIHRIDAGDRDELRAIAERLTVGETYFFRNPNDLAAFTDVVLPERIQARGDVQRLRILSAGCSSGEEPYTLAMLALGTPALAGWDVLVQGVDVNGAAIARARASRYGRWSLRQTSDAARERWFQAERRDVVRVVDEARALVRFEERNLADDNPDLWAAESWDVVFCRNVLMYLTSETTRRIVDRIEGALLPGGFLFLGHAETLRGVSSAFHLCHTNETFYYQRRGAAEARPAAPPPRGAAPAASVVPLLEADVDWLDVIRRASERVAGLSSGVAASPAAHPAAPDATPRDVARALALLREERFGDALEALGPAEDEVDPDALVLRAVILASSGDPTTAEAVCARILGLDELNAEAHYVLALCREHAGDRAAAANQDHYALYLDPTFAMPRLHLGLLAKRGGDVDGARRELSRALALLAGEDAARVLLLGGGFTRAALADVCRAELRACGGVA